MRESAGGIKVGLLDSYQRPVAVDTSFAALTCYNPVLPKIGETMDVKSRLFEVSHHTTLQHWHATFVIEGLSIGGVTFGFHLDAPFYDTDQRSGRFCLDMFANPDFSAIERYIRSYWPEVSDALIEEIIEYIKTGLYFFNMNKEKAAELCAKHLLEERPFASKKSLEANSVKIARNR
jgi:hypothetical protein